MADISQIKLPNNTTYNINAKTVNGHTVEKDVPSSAVFTDQYVTQVSSATEDGDYRVLLSGTVSDNTQTESVRKSAGLRFNPKYDAITIGYDRASGSAYGVCSLTQGSNIIASGQYSHGEGWWTIANHRSQHVFGEYNIADDSGAIVSNRGNYVEIVGNGTENARSNARTLDWNGNEVISGVYKDKYGVQCSRELTKAQYNALSTAEQNNGTDYYLTDADPSEYTDVWTKLGTAVLNTSAKNCSGAINELKSSLSDYFSKEFEATASTERDFILNVMVQAYTYLTNNSLPFIFCKVSWTNNNSGYAILSSNRRFQIQIGDSMSLGVLNSAGTALANLRSVTTTAHP